MLSNNLKVVDLFAGCGGMSLGFIKAGFEIVAAYDNWPSAIDVYRKNFKHEIFLKDLKNPNIVEEILQYSPDIIIGGPPCQDFSSAGHRNESLGRADLTISFAEIICKIKPKFFIMENVERIQKSLAFGKIKEQFNRENYGLTSIVLDASLCGVPQKRKRFFLIGELFGSDDFLTNDLVSNLSKSPMTIHDYLGDSLGVEYYFRIPRSYNRRAVFSIHEPCVTIRGVDRPIPKNYKKHPGDLVSIGDNVRALSVTERSYIQTFPKDFVFVGSKTNLNLMIGNAVPVELARFVGNALSNYLIRKAT
jgi:DNA (cytosine-5)-methyltransferase 1